MDLSKLHLHWRASSYKGKTYRSYSLARPYRENGRNRKEIVLKLGKLSDEQAMKWRSLLAALKKPDAFLTTLDDIAVNEHFSYLDVGAANAIWDEWKLDDIFTGVGKRKLALAKIARILTVNRCIDPAAKSRAPDWFKATALPWMLDFNPRLFNASRIFRELDNIEKRKEDICKHLFEQMNAHDPDTLKNVFYDLSTTTFSGSKCVLMKWGHCKEGYHNHVVLALVVNHNGCPFYWEVLPGGTADATTIAWLLKRLEERFKISTSTLVFDRGMVSSDNLTLIEKDKIKYISAMDKNQLEGITGDDFTKYSHLTPERVSRQADKLSNFTKLGNDTYYREVKVEGERRYILCFNPQLFKDQRKAREKAVESFSGFVNDMNAELSCARKSRQRKATLKKFQRKLEKKKLTGFVKVALKSRRIKCKSDDGSESDVRSYAASAVVDKGEMLHAGRLDGFWLLVTNHKARHRGVFDMHAADLIRPYREKTIIESSFRDIKSFVEVSPVHVWTKSHVRAHYTICVLAHLINRTLTLRLHENPGEETKDIFTHGKLYETLASCMIDHIEVENVGQSTYNMTKATHIQKELLQRLSMSRLLADDVVKAARQGL